jgi:phage/plasmid-like protein (TIGR03299 family)
MEIVDAVLYAEAEAAIAAAPAATNKSTTVSTRTVPWMTIGKLTDTVMTAGEAATLGGLGFSVAKRALYCDEPLDELGIRKIDERVAIVREDTGTWLGIMARDYPVLQYSEAFDFMDAVSPEYVAAGALKDGKQGFMVVKAPVDLDMMSDMGDDHDFYLVLRTSHDGSRAIEVSVMPLRGRCMNQLTLNSFSAGVPYRWSIKHTPTMTQKLQDAKEALANLDKYAKAFTRNAARLMELKITEGDAVEVLEDVLPKRPKTGEQIEAIITTWHGAETVGKEFDFTGWGLLNAVSDYFDWGRRGGTPESRFVNALQGQTHNAINRTTAMLLSA